MDQVLSAEKIHQKIRRIAYEIYEYNFKEKKIVFAGIEGQGYKLAGLIAKELRDISSIEVELLLVKFDKENPHFEKVELERELPPNIKYPILLIDDVLNTGRTMMYALRPFLEKRVQKIEIAVLVDRGHSMFPVKATYTGLSMSTTLNDHIKVTLNGNKSEVHLI